MEYGFNPSLTQRALPAQTSCSTSKQRVRLPFSPSGFGPAIKKTSLEPSLTTPTCTTTRKSRTLFESSQLYSLQDSNMARTKNTARKTDYSRGTKRKRAVYYDDSSEGSESEHESEKNESPPKRVA